MFALSLPPALLEQARVPQPWRVSSAVFLVLWGALAIRAIPRWIRLSRRREYALDRVLWALNAGQALSFLVLAANVANLFGAPATVYMICLASPLSVVMVSFFRLLWSFFPMEELE